MTNTRSTFPGNSLDRNTVLRSFPDSRRQISAARSVDAGVLVPFGSTDFTTTRPATTRPATSRSRAPRPNRPVPTTPQRRAAAGATLAAATGRQLTPRTALGAVLALLLVVFGVGVLAASPSESATPTATITVRSGDTLWSIARRVQPKGDVRDLVDQMARRNGGVTIHPGQTLLVSR